MEFQYRAGDERRSRSPPPAAPSTSSGLAEGQGGEGAAERVENSAVVPWQPPPPPPAPAAADADELRRQAVKSRIRERILREEAEHWELELEVRRELREQLLRMSWPVLGWSAGGSDPPVPSSPARMIAANSSPPVVALEVAQANSNANAPATSPAKRKNPDHVSGATGSKKQKLSLTCTLCGITANSEKAMQDHLNGKGHRRKAAATPPAQPAPEPATEPEAEEEDDGVVVTAPSGDYTPTKLTMLTSAGALDEVTQMDGYLLCEACNVRAADRVTMMCHLEGGKHISKAQKKRQAASEPATTVARSAATATAAAIASAVAGGDPDTVVLEVDGVAHTVQRVEGFLLCERCDMKATSAKLMRDHFSGKKHKTTANASPGASVDVPALGKEATKAQAIDKGTAVVAGTAAQVEAPLEKPLQAKVGGDSELQKTTTASAKEDVAAGDSTKTPGKEAMKATASAAAADTACDSDSLAMEVDGVQHPLRRADGFLICVRCNVKAPSEIIMRSHLGGKKHKHKMTLAAGRNKKGNASVVATAADQVQEGNASTSAKADGEAESAPSATTPLAKNATAVAPMEVDRPPAEVETVTPIEPAEDGEIAQEAEGEHAAAKANGCATQLKEPVKNDDAAAPGKPVKIQVEGKVFTVLQQENGELSCEPCGVHGCDKDGMILHLYTRTHWDKSSLAEEQASVR